MIADRIALTVAADMSANIFAAFLIVLIVLLARAGRPDEPVPPPAPIEVERDLAAVERRPDDAARLIEALRRRMPAAGTLAVDLHADRVELAGAAPPAVVALARTDGPAARARLAAAFRAVPADRPAVLYVFDAGWYSQVTATLTAEGRAFEELSVPAALSARGTGRSAWLPAFDALVASGAEPAAFRAGLARLIAGEGEDRADRAVARARLDAAFGGAGPPDAAGSLSDRLARLAGRALAAAAFAAALALVIYAETRRPRRRVPAR